MHSPMTMKAPPGGRRRWVARLTAVVALAWTVLVLLLALFADRWWPLLILEVVPPLAIPVVPLVGLAGAALVRPVPRVLTVVLALQLMLGVSLAGYGLGTARDRVGEQPGTAVKVFSWNTQYWDMSDDDTAFFAFLRRQDADVYLLQEYMFWQPGERPVRIDDSAQLRARFPGYQMSVDGELLTLSRLPVVATHDQPLPATGADWFWRASKIQRTDIRVGTRTVSFFNVHLPLPFRFSGSPASDRFWQLDAEQADWRIRNVNGLRADLAASPYPTLVAGDFNSPWMDLVPLGSGSRAHDPAGSLLPARSWPVSGFSFPRLWRLDWLYTTGDLTVPDYRFDGGAPFSDHAGQVISLVVPD